VLVDNTLGRRSPESPGERALISEDLIKLAFTGVGIAIGYLLKDHFDRRKEAEAARIADRRDHYRNLVLCLKSLNEGQRDKAELLRFEYTFLWLYAPDPVIRSFNELLRRLKSDEGAPSPAPEVGELVLAMRRDLGLRSTRLLASEFDAHAK
jgi:hypothetical protein